MVNILWKQTLPFLTHPALWQALFLSYWTGGHLGWIFASWSLLVGLSGALYLLSLHAPKYLDILTLFGSSRRFLIFWQLMMLLALRASTAEPLIAYWLNFFIWHTAIAGLVHWRWSFSLHGQGWAGFAAFFSWYGRSYPLMAALCTAIWAVVSYQRIQTGAHPRSEVALGSLIGAAASISYILL